MHPWLCLSCWLTYWLWSRASSPNSLSSWSLCLWCSMATALVNFLWWWAEGYQKTLQWFTQVTVIFFLVIMAIVYWHFFLFLVIWSIIHATIVVLFLACWPLHPRSLKWLTTKAKSLLGYLLCPFWKHPLWGTRMSRATEPRCVVMESINTPPSEIPGVMVSGTTNSFTTSLLNRCVLSTGDTAPLPWWKMFTEF